MISCLQCRQPTPRTAATMAMAWMARTPMSSVARQLLARAGAAGRRRPFLLACGMAGAKGVGCDLAIQSCVEGRSLEGGIDWRRTWVFGTFALGFTGMWQYCLFAKIMPSVVPGAQAFAAKPLASKLRDAVGMRGLATQVFIENVVNNGML